MVSSKASSGNSMMPTAWSRSTKVAKLMCAPSSPPNLLSGQRHRRQCRGFVAAVELDRDGATAGRGDFRAQRFGRFQRDVAEHDIGALLRQTAAPARRRCRRRRPPRSSCLPVFAFADFLLPRFRSSHLYKLPQAGRTSPERTYADDRRTGPAALADRQRTNSATTRCPGSTRRGPGTNGWRRAISAMSSPATARSTTSCGSTTS